MTNTSNFQSIVQHSTLVELLQWRAIQQPEQQAYTFLVDGEHEGTRLTYAALDTDARAIAALLQECQAQGERALLLYPPGLEFISAFCGCLYGGVIAIPAPPPDTARLKRTLPRLQAIARDAQASLVLTTASILATTSELRTEAPDLQAMRWIATDEVPRHLEVDWQEQVQQPDALAYLQYTSGSTATPKGVMISHNNVIHHCGYISQGWRYTPDSVAATWMPYFHDYGLIDGLIQPLYQGIPCFVMSPVAFIKRPHRWLQAISRYRVSHSQGPNFAYDYCARKITPEQAAELNLSSWRTASNGAEPIRLETLERFVSTFGPCGFHWDAFYPAYGLAEATLLVSTKPPSDRPRVLTAEATALEQNQIVEVPAGQKGGRTLVSCGCPVGGMRVVIADPQTLTQCPMNGVGEIWISDPSVAQGYWHRPEDTAETFQARLADTGEGPFLRTGDLGFLRDGELFVTGRLKDLIIIRGRNHYPQDIEQTVQQSHPVLRPDCGAAFAVEMDDDERLVVVQEVERHARTFEAEEIFGAIRQAIAEQHEVEVYGIVLLKTGSIPKTSSGKIQRRGCRAQFLDGSLDVLTAWTAQPATVLESPTAVVKSFSYVLMPTETSLPSLPANEQPRGEQPAPAEVSQRRAKELIAWLRSYASDRINSRLIDERRCIPPYIVLDFGNRGILGMQVPEEYGGLGLRNGDALRVVEQLAAVDLTLATFVCINNFLGIRPIQRYGSESLRAELLPMLATGRELAAFALTEPGAGSNPRAIAATATPDGQDSWRLQGVKIWSGSASWASVINVFVQLLDAQNQVNGSCGFAVRQGTPGLAMGPEALTMGMRGVVQNELSLQEVPVSAINLLGNAGTGMEVAQDAMLFTRLAIAAMCVGGMKRCTQLMLRYASRRSVATGRLLDNPVTLARLSEQTAAIAALETLVYRIAERLDQGEQVPVEAYIACKTAGPELLWKAADHLIQLLGGRGYIETNLATQILRDARIFRIFEGPTETLTMFLGSRVLNQGDELYEFLAKGLGTPQIADQLQAAAQQLQSRWAEATPPFADRPAARRWAAMRVGEVATAAILWAAVQGAIAQTPSKELQQALMWAQQQFQQAQAQALSTNAIESVLLSSEQATELVAGYQAAIGDLEQTLPGEDQALDALLCRAPEAVSHRPAPSSSPPIAPAPEPDSTTPSATAIQTWLSQWIAKELNLAIATIDVQQSLIYYGLDSVTLIGLITDLETWLGRQLPPTLAWDYPTIEALSRHLGTEAAPPPAPESAPKPAQPTEAPVAVIPKRDRLEALPLSYGQQRLWFLDQLDPGSPAYNHPTVLRLDGSLNILALEQSFNEIVRRHEALRTTFVAIEGQPVQKIAAEVILPLPVIDLRTSPGSERETEALRLARQEAQQPFDLAVGPLLRTTLVQLTDKAYILLLTMHHIVSDGWSMGVLFRELAVLYRAFCAGQPSPLPVLPIQYPDYALWQRQQLQGLVLAEQVAYWKQQLAGSPPTLDLPTDYPRPEGQTFQGARQSLALSTELTQALKTLSQQEGVTLFMTLLAAFQILLQRHTSQEEIVVGSPIAGRGRGECEDLIGFFVNTLVLRSYLGGNPSFQDLLGQVREVALGAYSHQDLPFEKLVEELQPERTLNRHPLFEVMLNFTSKPWVALELPELETKFLELAEPESKFTLTLYVEEQDNQLQLQLVYQQALFTAERMRCLLQQFQYLLEQVVADPNQRIHTYSLVTPPSRLLLPEPSAALAEPPFTALTDWLAEWATRAPETPALKQGDRTWTYGTLAVAAHDLAQGLLVQGLQPGEVVALTGSRSFGLIAGMIAVLLSGGVLLTLDRNLPAERQRLMLQTAQARYLLTSGGRAANSWIQDVPNLKILDLNPDSGALLVNSLQRNQQAFPLPELAPADPAYIFFTSGTTGVPKGVVGCHKGLSHFLQWQGETFAVGSGDRVAQITALSFDVVLRDIFLPLTRGATLCLPPEGDHLEPTRILLWLEREQISLLHLVPSLAQAWLVNAPPGVSLRHLRCLFFAGEPLTDRLIHRWRERFPEMGAIINLYGPTETTLAKCFYQVPEKVIAGVQPVGFPLPNTQALVMSTDHRLCGIGEPGEIVLRTPCRSLGYLNAAEDNQRRFVQNPFRDDPSDWLYYTGDRGRYRPDGSLEILGRLDHQVKIRGVRVELGEIEAALAAHPLVRESVVLVREAPSGDRSLVAYVVPNEHQDFASGELRRYLQHKLPDALVPSAFVVLESLPLTPNGKIDRRALPAPSAQETSLAVTASSPQDELEQQLTRIWEQVLGIHPIGIRDNFFDLGGHSLLAVSLFAQIEKSFGKKLPLATLFQAATIEDLAQVIRQEGWLAPWSSLVQIQPGEKNRLPLFLVHGAGGNVLVFHKLAQHLGTDQPVYGLQAKGLDGKLAPHTSIEDMAAHYVAHIRTVQPEGPYCLAGLSNGGLIAWEMAQRLYAQGQPVALLGLFDTSGPGYPRLLPPLPRFLSTFAWLSQDVGHRALRLPARLLRKYQRLQLNKVQSPRSEEDNMTTLLRESHTQALTEQARQYAGDLDLEKRINFLLISMLKRSSYPYYAEVFANGLCHSTFSALPTEVQTVREANLKAKEAYTPQVYPGRVVFFRASDRAPGIYRDPQVGWGGMAEGSLEIHEVPGRHASIINSPVLAKRLRACLDQALADIAEDA